MHPDFKGMPKPVTAKTLSWEDIWDEAQETCQDRHGRGPTREEIIDIFDDVVRKEELHNDTTPSIVDAIADFYDE